MQSKSIWDLTGSCKSGIKEIVRANYHFPIKQFHLAAPADEIYGEKLLRYGAAEVECFPKKLKCYFGEKTVYLSSKI